MEFFPVKDMDEVVRIAFPQIVQKRTPKASAKLSVSSVSGSSD
jgi:hypothetical protein